MFIQLNKSRAIKSDSTQYMVCKLKHVAEHTDKHGVTTPATNVWEPYKYYMTLQRALESLPETFLKESNAKGWAECKRCLQSTYKLIADEMHKAGNDG